MLMETLFELLVQIINLPQTQCDQLKSSKCYYPDILDYHSILHCVNTSHSKIFGFIKDTLHAILSIINKIK
ncbi:unnamed protein product [Spodoptera exigua]|nr:unnamed protein product [Spodoptera exigua]